MFIKGSFFVLKFLNIEGEYGPSIKSWSNVLYSANEMTTENITQLFNTAGVLVSKSTVLKFILDYGKSMQTEKIALLKQDCNQPLINT